MVFTGGHSARRIDPPPFSGIYQVFKLVGALFQRPRIGDRARKLSAANVEWRGYERERSRQGLPMVNLVRSDRQRELLPAFMYWLENAWPKGVRYAYVNLRNRLPGNGVDAVRSILVDVRKALVGHTRVTDGPPRFELFSLVVWLMTMQIPPTERNPDRLLFWELQKHGLNERIRTAIERVGGNLPDSSSWLKVLVGPLQLLTVGWFRFAVTGRIPVISGRYRWFLRQPHLAPEMSGSFVRFARRLTDGEWQDEAPEYVSRLLVNAFLEDLRREYRLRPWQIWRKRRMTYLVLLLDDITADNGGFEILRLLNEVRNQVGLFDPLLVISAGAAVPPPDAGQNEPGRPRHQAINAGLAYRTWQNELRNARRARGVTAWYLPIAIPDSGSDGELEQAEAEFGSFDGYATSRRQASPHWWSSRVVRIGAVALLLVLAIGGPTAAVVQLRDSHCGTGDSMLTSIGDECIGMSDGSYDLFQPSNDSIHQVVQKIYLQNQQAEQLHLDVPARPYLTLVGMHALTSSNGTAEGLTAEREEMEGMAIAQLRQLRARGLSDPIVRILIANAGQEMHAGVQVAAQLRDLADRDRSIVAVVGLDMSSTATEKTISALSNAGLPTVASTLSADGLADLNPMYFQVAPQNRREAEIAAAFVDRLSGQPRAVRVYYSDDSSDSYSTNLRDDAFTSFHTRKFAIQTRAFTPNLPATGPPSHEKYGDPLIGNAAAAGRDTCSYRGYVFFVGRGVPDFGDFMSGAAQCGSQAVFVGGDDVTRFVADQVARQQNRALPYYYLSFATAPVAQPAGPARDFYSSLAQEFTFEQGAQGRSLDGHAALSYDAAEVVITAAAYLRETAATIPVTPGSIWREITAIHTSQVGPKQTNKQLEGVTGTIDFGGDLGRNVPQSKPVAVLRVENGEVDPTIRGFCGHAADRSPAPWCPAIG